MLGCEFALNKNSAISAPIPAVSVAIAIATASSISAAASWALTLTLALTGECIGANIPKRGLHRIWLRSTAVTVSTRATFIAPVLIFSTEICTDTWVGTTAKIIRTLTA